MSQWPLGEGTRGPDRLDPSAAGHRLPLLLRSQTSPFPPSRTEDPDSVTLPPGGWFQAQTHINGDTKPLVTPSV